jgi:ubiquinone/menaquinone biosynthesis C-methylase UbiE
VVALLLAAAAVASAQQSTSGITAERIFKTIGAQEGLTLCEIGAGDGEMSLAAARRVGPRGRIYSSELGDGRVKTLREKVAASGIANITVVAGEAGSTNFPDGECDAVFMNDVYHHFTDPAAMNRSIAAALRPGGRLAVVDFTPPGQEAARPSDRAKDGMHGVKPETVTREVKEAGFEPAASEAGSRWFLVAFVTKPVT